MERHCYFQILTSFGAPVTLGRKKKELGLVCKGDSSVKEQNLPGRKKGERKGVRKRTSMLTVCHCQPAHGRLQRGRFRGGDRYSSTQQHLGRRLCGLRAS